jgi:ATP-dependent exoDNAse (exonuclease V) alpha subunit
LNERMGDFDFYTRWLYTAVTRAVDKLVIAL